MVLAVAVQLVVLRVALLGMLGVPASGIFLAGAVKSASVKAREARAKGCYIFGLIGEKFGPALIEVGTSESPRVYRRLGCLVPMPIEI